MANMDGPLVPAASPSQASDDSARYDRDPELRKRRSIKRTLSMLSAASTITLGRLSQKIAKNARNDAQSIQMRDDRRQAKALLKSMLDFHKSVSGAVFVGTIVRADIELERTADLRYYVDAIELKYPAQIKSSKQCHFDAFSRYYSGDNKQAYLECCFEVFMRRLPEDGARVSFIVKPIGVGGMYVALACNVIKV